MSARKVYFVSLGCPKNQVDTEVMLGSVGAAGQQLVDSPEEADVIVVNTCAFIDAAKEESIDTILEMAEYKTQGRCEKLVVTGCLSQRFPEELRAEIPEIDHLVGSADFSGIAHLVAPPRGKSLPVVQVSQTPAYLYDHTAPRQRIGQTHTAYVKIAEGCDRPCAFCIIPKLRGPQRSREIASVVAEVQALVADGTREINLIAQDLTRYGADLEDKPTLAMLLRQVARVPGIDWVRLHYTYPSAFTDELIEVIAEEPTVVKYVDVPLQHIDDSMLKIMRRGHGSKVTRDLITRLRERIEGLVLRTTFIVGHPGETEEMFEALCEFVRESKFDRMGAFTYSAEPGTVSSLLPDHVPAEVARERQEVLMELQREVSREKGEGLIGSVIDVLVEGVSDESEYLLQGRWYGQAPEIDGVVYLADGAAPTGSIVKARITDAADYDLAASLLLDGSSSSPNADA